MANNPNYNDYQQQQIPQMWQPRPAPSSYNSYTSHNHQMQQVYHQMQQAQPRNQQEPAPVHYQQQNNQGSKYAQGAAGVTFLQPSSKRYHVPGKSSNSKDADDKKDENELWSNVEAQAAFLGPNLWDKTLPYEADLKVQEYVDLDEFLSENGMPGDGLAASHLATTGFSHSAGLSMSGIVSQVTKRERSPSPSECMSPDTINPPLSPADSTFSMASSGRDFDPRTRAFSDEELKPQPMVKKSRKQFVPEDLKDDKYWARRRKNNMAAKRSRDARRMKENQIALRAGYLEKENMNLRHEVECLKKENLTLRERLSKYTEV